MKCATHKTYKAKRQPKADCDRCWRIWLAKELNRMEGEYDALWNDNTDLRQENERLVYDLVEAEGAREWAEDEAYEFEWEARCLSNQVEELEGELRALEDSDE